MKSALLPPLLGCLLMTTARAAAPVEKTWTVDGTPREALIFSPAHAAQVPAIFVFHGHGGRMQYEVKRFALQKLWPEAVIVYMQGLLTPSKLVDPEGRGTGWQERQGAQNDRDLHFFDAVLATLKDGYGIDPGRVYVTGHSNGGLFTYLLMSARPKEIAACAPCAAIAPAGTIPLKTPKPVFHIVGWKNPVVHFEWQQRTMERVKRLDGVSAEGRLWAREGAVTATLYPSQKGTPFIEGAHPGGHIVPDGAPALIVRFFKEQGAALPSR